MLEGCGVDGLDICSREKEKNRWWFVVKRRVRVRRNEIVALIYGKHVTTILPFQDISQRTLSSLGHF